MLPSLIYHFQYLILRYKIRNRILFVNVPLTYQLCMRMKYTWVTLFTREKSRVYLIPIFLDDIEARLNTPYECCIIFTLFPETLNVFRDLLTLKRNKQKNRYIVQNIITAKTIFFFY